MKDLCVEDNKNGQGYPVVADNERGVEDWILEELDHTFARL